MIREGVIGAVLMGMSMIAFGANWVPIGGNQTVTITADTESIVHSGNIVKVWTTSIYTVPTRRPGFTFPLSRQVSRWIFNCADRTSATGETISYDASNSPADNDPGTPNQFEDVAPDTVSETILDAVCAKPK